MIDMELFYENSNIINKKEYDIFVDNSPQGSIFAKSWWLDTLCDEWMCASIKDSSGRIHCALPLPYYKRHFRGAVAFNPVLTRYLGFLFRESEGRNMKILSNQTQLINKIAPILYKYRKIDLLFHYNFNCWLPFKKFNFSAQPYYTYILNTSLQIEDIRSGYRENIRREIKKASKIFNLTDVSLNEFYDIYSNSFLRKGSSIPISYDKLNKLHFKLKERNACYIVGAREGAQLVSAAYIVVDNKEHRYLMGGTTDAALKKGASSFVLDRSILNAKNDNKHFNFEGSMNEDIIRYFRSFGGDLTTYYRILRGFF
jgi:hypothetical protein